jgi:hypothetical protein
VDVVDVPLEIGVVADGMLPVATLSVVQGLILRSGPKDRVSQDGRQDTRPSFETALRASSG